MPLPLKVIQADAPAVSLVESVSLDFRIGDSSLSVTGQTRIDTP